MPGDKLEEELAAALRKYLDQSAEQGLTVEQAFQTLKSLGGIGDDEVVRKRRERFKLLAGGKR
jgi:hypothetical protein